MKYQYSDSVQITSHFNSTEFRCQCGKEHEFELNNNLDKAVKGSGTRQHTLGNAADICCYGQDGQPISSKVVCCKAQDIGFTGIANITAAYQYTHVDVRPNDKWYGDEVHGNSSVTDDFYKYFGGEDMKGIDVSVHNGDIDWQKVKADGIDFAIIRAGYGKLESQKDQKFEQNYAGKRQSAFRSAHTGTPTQ